MRLSPPRLRDWHRKVAEGARVTAEEQQAGDKAKKDNLALAAQVQQRRQRRGGEAEAEAGRGGGERVSKRLRGLDPQGWPPQGRQQQGEEEEEEGAAAAEQPASQGPPPRWSMQQVLPEPGSRALVRNLIQQLGAAAGGPGVGGGMARRGRRVVVEGRARQAEGAGRPAG
jgi:hypothetical protein